MSDVARLSVDQIARTLAARGLGRSGDSSIEHSAAVAFVLRPSDEGVLETLFIKRAEHPNDPWSGQMSFPGGRREDGDQTLEETARREAQEEVGLGLDADRCIGQLSPVSSFRKLKVSASVVPLVYGYEGSPEVELSPEADDAVWVPLSFLSEPSHVRPYPFPTGTGVVRFPSFRHGEYTIWGMTYRMIHEFMAALGVHLPVPEPE